LRLPILLLIASSLFAQNTFNGPGSTPQLFSSTVDASGAIAWFPPVVAADPAIGGACTLYPQKYQEVVSLASGNHFTCFNGLWAANSSGGGASAFSSLTGNIAVTQFPLGGAPNYLAYYTGTAWTLGQLSFSQIAGSATYSQLTGVQASLGYTPANVANNGADFVSASSARTNLGLAIGANVEAWSAELDALSAKTQTGTGAKIATSTGTLTYTHCVSIGSAGDLVDNGGTCGTGSGNVNGSGLTGGLFVVGSGSSAIVISAYGPTSFLQDANNLSDLASASTARSNLGLGAAATETTAFFLQASNNLSDLGSPSTARTNLGLGAAAVQANAFFLQASNNLSDIGAASTARTNLGLGTAATQTTAFFAQAANNLSDLASASTARTNLGLGTAATQTTAYFQAALGFTPANIANNLSDLTNESTARTNLGLAIGTNVQAYSANLTTLASVAGQINYNHTASPSSLVNQLAVFYTTDGVQTTYATATADQSGDVSGAGTGSFSILQTTNTSATGNWFAYDSTGVFSTDFVLSATPAGSNTWTFPANINDTAVGLAATQTLTNKTLTSPALNTPTIMGATYEDPSGNAGFGIGSGTGTAATTENVITVKNGAAGVAATLAVTCNGATPDASCGYSLSGSAAPASVSTGNGGVGASSTISTPGGGATSANSATGGAGGTVAVTCGGTGGAATGTTATGGAGGPCVFSSGQGGNGTGTNGAAGYYQFKVPNAGAGGGSAGAAGFVEFTNAGGGTVWDKWSTSGLQVTDDLLTTAGVGHPITLGAVSTSQSAAISTSTLCGSGATQCGNAGEYHVHWSIVQTVGCATPSTGAAVFSLTWTDAGAVQHAAVVPQSLNQTSATATAWASTYPFTTTANIATSSSSGDYNVITNGTIIQYAVAFTACGTGTPTFTVDAAVTRLQ
jgi:hypothetical protein